MVAQFIGRRAASLLCAPAAPARAAVRATAAPAVNVQMPSIYHQSAALASVHHMRALQSSRLASAPSLRSLATATTASMVDAVKAKNQENPVIVYSKTWCPYCAQVKELFKQLDVPAKIVELDQVVEGDDVQAALYDISFSRTVPQVFIGGDFVGGCDDTLLEQSSGQLQKRLEAVGITGKSLE